MSEIKDKQLPYDRAIGNVLGIVNCLLIISEVSNYRNWLREFHNSDLNNMYFSGYKLLFNTLFRMLVSELERNQSLNLSSDDMFERATFHGISVDKLQNTCEKTILVKNLKSYFKEVINSENWSSLEHSLQKTKREVLYPFNQISQISITNQDYPVNDMEIAIKYSSIFQAYIFLNDTSRRTPHGYLPAMIDDVDFTLGYRYRVATTLGDAFIGYKYGVQFIWYQLLGNEFIDSIVSHLHQANDWQSFDSFFKKIQTEIIEPLEKKTSGHMGYEFFILTDGNPRDFFHPLLEREQPEISLSPKENIRRIFLWYPIQFIDSSEYSFSGIPAFIPLLMGMIQVKRRSKNKSKAKVVRIIHGQPDEHRRSYSYAVLSELSGFISDSSGWLLFFDCCDDQGSTSLLFSHVELFLNRYLEKDYVEITNIRVEKDVLLDLLKEDVVSKG